METNEYLTDEISNEAVGFIERHTDKPFLLYLAYNASLQATPEHLERFPHIMDKKRRTCAAMVSAMDDGVGRALDTLQKHDRDEHTRVVYLSDNGGPTHKNSSSNEPLRYGKGSPYEGGVRVPFAISWTGMLPAGAAEEETVISLDVFATIASLTAAPLDADRPLDGIHLMPYLTGEQTGGCETRIPRTDPVPQGPLPPRINRGLNRQA